MSSEGHLPRRMVLINYTFESYRVAALRLGADHLFDKAKRIPEVLTVWTL